jgi:hypothetical protein
VKEILSGLNDGSLEGYLGVNKTLNSVKQRYYWLHVRIDVRRWCQKSDTCVSRRGPWTCCVIGPPNGSASFEKMVSNRIKTHHCQLAISGDSRKETELGCTAWPSPLGRSPKLQPSWAGPCRVTTQIDDPVYKIQLHPKAKIMVVCLDILSSYLGATWKPSSAMLTNCEIGKLGHVPACECLSYIKCSRSSLLVDSSRNFKHLVHLQKHRTTREILWA